MSNRYIRQSLEREMILLGIEEKEVSAFINSSVGKVLKEGEIADKTIRTWPSFYLYSKEALVCSKCHKTINEERAYLGLCDNNIDEVLCDVCWRTMPEWRKEE